MITIYSDDYAIFIIPLTCVLFCACSMPWWWYYMLTCVLFCACSMPWWWYYMLMLPLGRCPCGTVQHFTLSHTHNINSKYLFVKTRFW